jgi:general secretion pathway protein K
MQNRECKMRTERVKAKGGALLAVLWLSAALAAIAFSLASTVGGEIERTSTALDGTRAYYLASGALERALLYMQWGQRYSLPDGTSRYYSRWTTSLHFSFPSGEAVVEIAPESARLNVNRAVPEDLFRLLLALGANPERAREITAAIQDWRSVPPQGRLTDFDLYYLALTPSFRAPHASFQSVEELLSVKGMTPELFHGTMVRAPQGGLVARIGLKDCVSVYGSGGQVDINAAPGPVLASTGLDPVTVNAILRQRQAQPFRSLEQLRALQLPDVALVRLTIGGGPIYTLRATARLRLPNGKLSDLSRSVGATVRFGKSGVEGGYEVLRWWDFMLAGDERWM